MLECVINVSEGRRRDVVDAIAAAAGRHLLDVHVDADHHRSVLTLAGAERDVADAAYEVVRAAVERIDLRHHLGAHPRLGAADVVPFVPLGDLTIDHAVSARRNTAARIGAGLGVPCFLYGDGDGDVIALPDVRREAFKTVFPDAGPREPHPSAGACCVGARYVLVAYNLWLAPPATVADAKRIAAAIRTPQLRTLGLDVGGRAQVSCNLVAPIAFGPAEAYDAVASHAPVERAELVGLVPGRVVDGIPSRRWSELDVSSERTIEARLDQAGLDGGSSM
ncbi:MAG TPA: hypothetical protein VF230_17620 [Acidimicrobiales bacterium]